MNFLVINGPNMNLLGIREPDIYGKGSYRDLCLQMEEYARMKRIGLRFVQSNSEGALVDAIQSALGKEDGIIINPAAYTHTSVAILDALRAVNLPAIEVHISDPDTREPFRRVNFVRPACQKTISGKGFQGYLEAVDALEEILRK